MLRALAAWLGLALFGAVSAAAQAPALEVVQPGAGVPGCITTLELQRRVEERRGPLTDHPQGTSKHVRVSFGFARDGSLEVRVVLRDAQGLFLGQRRLRADPARCREVDDALVLVVTSLFGLPREVAPAALEEAPAPPDEEDGGATAPLPLPREPESTPAPARPPRPPREPFRLRALWAGALTTGTTASAAGGLAAGLWGERTRWGFDVQAQAVPRSQSALAGGGAVRFQALWAQGLLCGAAATGDRARLDLCAGPRLGLLRAASQGLASDGTQLAPLLDVAFGPRLSLGRRSAASRAYLAALVVIPLLITELQVMEQDGDRRTYHENGPGIWLAAGLSWRPSS